MWAFAIHDKEKDNIFCSRDRFGIKPFYFMENNEKFVFGSEIKQILVYKQKIEANKTVLMDYLITGFQDFTNNTFFDDVSKLEQSHNLIYDLNSNTYIIKKYYEIKVSQDTKELSLTDSIEKYEEKLNNSISLRLRSDVKVGTCLSGGIDSSAVTTIASKKYGIKTNEKFTAIHAKSIEKLTDESKYAQIVSENTDNINLQIIEPTNQDFKDNIDEVVFTQEEPFGSPSIFMQYFVMKKAKELNCKVMLDGQGGDETLLGYEKYYPAAYIELYKRYGIIDTLKEIIKTNKNNDQMSIVWISKLTIGSIFFNIRRKMYLKKCDFIKDQFLDKFEHLEKFSKTYFDVDRLQKYEIMNLSLPALLRYEDKNSMRHSIETRLPFIDYQLLELGLSLNTKHKINDGWTKFVLRKIIDKLLPSSIVWRKSKLGFNAPEKTWIDNNAEIMIQEILNSKILNKVSDINALLSKFPQLDYRLKWRLYNIACWERIYNVQNINN